MEAAYAKGARHADCGITGATTRPGVSGVSIRMPSHTFVCMVLAITVLTVGTRGSGYCSEPLPVAENRTMAGAGARPARQRRYSEPSSARPSCHPTGAFLLRYHRPKSPERRYTPNHPPTLTPGPAVLPAAASFAEGPSCDSYRRDIATRPRAPAQSTPT